MKNSILGVSFVVVLCFALNCQVQATQGITEQDAKVLFDRVLKIYNTGDVALIAEVYAPEVVAHASAFPGDIIGHEGIKNWVESSRIQFPDMNLTFDETFVIADKMVTIWTLTGTNTGPILESPPTGKKIRITGLSVDYVKNGKVVKEITVYNVLDMMTQLGFELNPPKTKK